MVVLESLGSIGVIWGHLLKIPMPRSSAHQLNQQVWGGGADTGIFLMSSKHPSQSQVSIATCLCMNELSPGALCPFYSWHNALLFGFYLIIFEVLWNMIFFSQGYDFRSSWFIWTVQIFLSRLKSQEEEQHPLPIYRNVVGIPQRDPEKTELESLIPMLGCSDAARIRCFS